jgi:flavin-dependent dehydrogenase
MVADWPLVIVGGGPAGAGTALFLERLDPGLARRTLLVDQAEFPRDKTCAGGLIPHAVETLAGLGLRLDVPYVRVDRARVLVGGEPIEIEVRGCCFVVRRRELDAMLLAAVKQRGVTVQEGVKLKSARRDGERIVLDTSRGEITARAVVGADGAGSLVRRALVDPNPGKMARALMCDVPADRPGAGSTFEFDFRAVRGGLQGYAWSFPCLIDGAPHLNVGVYSLRRASQGARLAELLGERGAASGLSRKAHPIRLYEPGARISEPGVLLVGDAAGVEPLLGEGISFALGYGELAARTLASGFRRGDLRFAGYAADVAGSPMGRKLRHLALAARLFYGGASRFWFAVAQLSRRAQKVGMAWYNGTPQPLRAAIDSHAIDC